MPPGPPTCLVWASSDAPALTGGYLGTVRAVRDFCLAYGVRLVCIGAPPPGLAVEAGVATEHLGMMPYHAYLAHLRSPGAGYPGGAAGHRRRPGDAGLH